MGCGGSTKARFMKIFETSTTSKEILIEKVTLEKQPYFDLLSNISMNKNLEAFMMKHVHILGTDYNKMVHLVKTLQRVSTLKSLELIGLSDLENKKGQSIYFVIKQLDNLERLVIRELDLDEDDAKYIKHTIELNKIKLTYLDLGNNFFGVKLKSICLSFAANTSFSTIILTKVNMRGEELTALLQSLKNNPVLELLDLSHNTLGDSVEYFTPDFFLSVNLQKLFLNNCEIDSHNLIAMLGNLKDNKKMTHLELNNNHIEDTCANKIALFFQINKTLNFLYLLQNKIRQRDILNIVPNSDLKRCIIEL
jgi:hypothetical protein